MTDEALPTIELVKFHRIDKGALLGAGEVRIAGHLRLKVKLIAHGSGPMAVGPSIPSADRTGWDHFARFSGPLGHALTELLTEAHAARPKPGERSTSCPDCGALIWYVHNRRREPGGETPHLCAA